MAQYAYQGQGASTCFKNTCFMKNLFIFIFNMPYKFDPINLLVSNMRPLLQKTFNTFTLLMSPDKPYTKDQHSILHKFPATIQQSVYAVNSPLDFL